MKVTLWIPDDLATGLLAEGALPLEQRLALDLAFHGVNTRNGKYSELLVAI
jgi:hypothetical protein